MTLGGTPATITERGTKKNEGYPTLRVNQLDAQRVNEELFRALTNDAASTFFSHAPPGLLHRWLPELHLVLRLLLWGSYFKHQRPLPGDMLQNVKYYLRLPQAFSRSSRDGAPSSPTVQVSQSFARESKYAQSLPNRTIALYLLFSAIIPYTWNRLQRLMQQWEWARVAQHEQQERRRSASGATSSTIRPPFLQWLLSLLWPLLRLCDTAISSFIALNAFVFIVEGEHRSLVDRLLGLKMAHIAPAAPRHVSFEVLNRHLYWHSFTELMLVVAPLLYIPQMRAYTKRFLYPTLRKLGDLVVRLFRNIIRTKQFSETMRPFFNKVLIFLRKLTSPFVTLARWMQLEESQPREAFSNLYWSGQEECTPEGIQKTLTELSCVFCGISPIVMAFQGDCGHPFCYWCVSAGKYSERQLMCSECGADIGEIRWLR
ncbi:Pex2 / Pex12 amino terminal region protein [Cardiosporidium cionae]|uniref:RING-type E3 ubiquitin transferase (cysteine targeting) n=1 Tax=Cardiosporidium cionae TaxID=476202 RepID=A0ABQ7JBX8_9APIC|nr:Pex2 / Pex12 amino terminal region protein [Cardiosporidium cionae]|eukprot:KAF8821510.1 Pex2 / Pex12 amino terminal region protein [Cardiosporidium cionae]